jgi:probable HAF family extracellular repeat protein
MKPKTTLRTLAGGAALIHAAVMQISRSRRTTLSVVFMCALVSPLLPVSAANYVVTDLGTLGGDCSRATDLNSLGQVVGVARTAEGRDRAFLWQTNSMTELGALGGTNSHAAAINEAGEIVGWAETPEGWVRACLFGPVTNVDLSTGHTNKSYATDINDAGRVVGWIETPVSGADQPMPTAVLFGTNGLSMQTLSVDWEGRPYRGRATVINNSNLIAGWTGDLFWTWAPRDRATFWQGLSSSASTRYSNIDSSVRGLNGTGQMVGESGYAYVARRATSWSGTNQLNLGSLALGTSTAAAINNAGQVVGSAEAYRFGLISNWFGLSTNGFPPSPQVYEGFEPTRHAFLCQNGVMSDLNDLIPTNSGWELTEAVSINDAGQIVGTGNFSGQTRAFLLIPVLNPNQIPFVRVLSPTDGEWVSGSSITLHAEANDADGQIRKVEFFAKRVTRRNPQTGELTVLGTLLHQCGDHPPGYLGTTTNAPFTFNVTNLAAGNYLILAKATDDQGATACAAEVLLRLNAPPYLILSQGELGGPSSPPPTNFMTLRLANVNEERTYYLESSTDLANWTNAGLPSSDFNYHVFHVSEPDAPRRFYRAVAR